MGWKHRPALEDAQWTHVATTHQQPRPDTKEGRPRLFVAPGPGGRQTRRVHRSAQGSLGSTAHPGNALRIRPGLQGEAALSISLSGPLISSRVVTPSVSVPLRQPAGQKNTEPHRPFCPGQLRREPWGEIAWTPALPIPSCVTSNKSLNLSVPLFPSAACQPQGLGEETKRLNTEDYMAHMLTQMCLLLGLF